METSHFFQTLHKEHISLVRSIYYRVEKSDVFFSINMASNLLKYVYESIDKEKKKQKTPLYLNNKKLANNSTILTHFFSI